MLPHAGGILDQDDALMAQLEQAQFAKYIFDVTGRELIKLPAEARAFRQTLVERVYG